MQKCLRSQSSLNVP
uniref:Uncharacterized protein n=1 Tax=Rhizophora mucronata TaxID=61149 RepID=A0A2P2NXR0_RHIMU